MKFDTSKIAMILSAAVSESIDLCTTKHLGAPVYGENREAGENPARSRHCDEIRNCLYEDGGESLSQETCPSCFAAS